MESSSNGIEALEGLLAEDITQDAGIEELNQLDATEIKMPAIAKAAKEEDSRGRTFYRVPGRALGIQINPRNK